MEIWKDIEGWEGVYQISNLGRVKSFPKSNRLTEEIKVSSISTLGYKRLGLYRNQKQKNVPIHRLVAMAFIPNPNNYPQVNHIDGIKTNNNISNLEWCTQKENVCHAYRLGLKIGKRGETCNFSKLQTSDVLEIKQRIKNGEMQKNIAKTYGVSISAISDIKRLRRWQHL